MFSGIILIMLFTGMSSLLVGVQPVGTSSSTVVEPTLPQSTNQPGASAEIPLIEWNKTFGGTGDDDAYSVIRTSDGGYAVVGIGYNGSGFARLVKTDANGNLQWGKTYEEGLTSVAQTSDGGYALAGWLEEDFWLVKTDQNGRMAWNKTYRVGPWAPEFYGSSAHFVVQTSDGGYVVAGDWLLDDPFYMAGAFVLLRTDSLGNQLWKREYRSSGALNCLYLESCIRTSDGGFALVGSGNSWVDDINSWGVLVKTDASGNMQWMKTYAFTELPFPSWTANSVVQTADGGFALAGTGPWNTEEYPSGYHFWLVKTDSNGNTVWNKTYGDGYEIEQDANSLVPTIDGGYLLGGYAFYSSTSTDHAWLVKTDSLGNHQWNKTLDGSNIQSIIRVSNDQYVMAGSAPDPSGDSDFLLIKLALRFADGFESGSFSNWSGVSVSTGETASVVYGFKHHGSYSAAFASNGGGSYEKSYCHRSISARSEIYARGYFYVSQSGIVDDGDWVFFFVFRTGTNGVACGGWRKAGGMVKWHLKVRDGTSYVSLYSSTIPAVGRWYCVEFHWKKGAINGLAEMWVDGVRVCSVSGVNTAAYGDVNSVEFGLPQLYNCGPTRVYGDCCVVARTYIGPESSPVLFVDGFESGSFSKWTGTSATTGETKSVVSTLMHHGTHSAKFTSNGGGGTEYSYCYKTITPSSELYARAYFRVSQSGIVQTTDNFYLIAFRTPSNTIAYAGWRVNPATGLLRWSITIRHGTSSVVAYSATRPLLNTWYSVELRWKKSATGGLGQLWVNGVLVCSITGKNTAAYGSVNQVRFGLPFIYNCGSTTAYCDCVKIAVGYIGPES